MINILSEKWRESGVKPGDTILLHSNIKRTLAEAREIAPSTTPHDILESYIEAIGPKGTLLLPLFNFDFCNGKPFDIRNTQSQMGALTEIGRKHSKAIRTGHPIYSFAAIGYYADEFKGINNESGYAADSPFGILRKLDGKIGVLDLEDQSSMTFYHHVEEIKQVDYRYFKNFTGEYTDAHGKTSQSTYKLFVRDLDRGVKTDVNNAGELMWQSGIYQGFKPNIESGLRTVDANIMFDFVCSIIDDGRALGTLYSIEENDAR